MKARAGARQAVAAAALVVLAQLLTVLNVSALKLSVDGIATSLAIPASSVKTALVTYSIVVAGFTLLGAKLARNIGLRRSLHGTIALFAVAMVATMLARGFGTLMLAQAVAGAAAATLLPASSSLLSSRRQQGRRRALGWLGAAQATSIVPAYLIAGAVASWASWRATFGLLAGLALCALLLSAKVGTDAGRSSEPVDRVGVLIVAAAILFIGLGSEKLASWGLLGAQPDAPFSMLRVSPALLAIVCGGLLLKVFVVWSERCRARGGVALIPPELLRSEREWAVLLAIFAVGAIASGVTFLIPLYVEVVQGRSSLYTAIVLVPFAIASFGGAIAVLRLQTTFKASFVARVGFAIVATGVALLAITIRNDWSNGWVIASMILAGTGEGALATHLLNVLALAAPRKLAPDVGPLCGATSSLAAGVGTALAGALAIGVLGTVVQRDLVRNSALPPELRIELNVDSVAFVSNDRLREALERRAATPEQLDAVVRLNTEARLLALKVTLISLAGLAALAFLPAGALPEPRPPGEGEEP